MLRCAVKKSYKLDCPKLKPSSRIFIGDVFIIPENTDQINKFIKCLHPGKYIVVNKFIKAHVENVTQFRRILNEPYLSDKLYTVYDSIINERILFNVFENKKITHIIR